MARHDARARSLGPSHWDVVCTDCPGDGARVGESATTMALTLRRHAEDLADLHRELYSDLGDRMLR